MSWAVGKRVMEMGQREVAGLARNGDLAGQAGGWRGEEMGRREDLAQGKFRKKEGFKDFRK